MNRNLLFYGSALVVTLALIGLTRLTTTTDGLLAAAGAYDQYGYNRISREFKGTGSQWCLARKKDPQCLGEYSVSTFFIKWNAEWDRGVRDAWIRTPYNAEIKLTYDNTLFTVVWVGNCYEGEALPTGGTCVWGEYAGTIDTGADVYSGLPGAWLGQASPSQF